MDDICLSLELDGTFGMPTFEHSGEHRHFWEERIQEKGRNSEFKLETKCKCLRKHQVPPRKKYLLLRVVAP
jgi:hypothetical protein